MKNIFIELTDKDDSKILVNVLQIVYIEKGKTGSIIMSDLVNHSFSKKVKESYDEIKSLIASLTQQ